MEHLTSRMNNWDERNVKMIMQGTVYDREARLQKIRMANHLNSKHGSSILRCSKVIWEEQSNNRLRQRNEGSYAKPNWWQDQANHQWGNVVKSSECTTTTPISITSILWDSNICWSWYLPRYNRAGGSPSLWVCRLGWCGIPQSVSLAIRLLQHHRYTVPLTC
jgi:hypothetical protein